MKILRHIGSLPFVLVLSVAPGILVLLSATVFLVAFPSHPSSDYLVQIFNAKIAILLLLVLLAGAVTLAAIGPKKNRTWRILLVAALMILTHVGLWFVCAISLVLILMDF